MPSSTPAQQFKITRTNAIPVTFTGRHVGSFESSNKSARNHQLSRQWFETDVYTTVKGTWIANCRYRAGSNIRREAPVDLVLTAKSPAELGRSLESINPVQTFVTGWPGEGAPSENEGRDLTRNHQDVCRYAAEQWKDVVAKIVVGIDAAAAEVID